MEVEQTTTTSREVTFKLSPLAKSLNIGDAERLTYLRNFFYRLTPQRQRFLFPFLKPDLQRSLITKGYVYTSK